MTLDSHYKRILRFPEVTAQKVRVRFVDGKDIPVISELGIYNAPKLLLPPKATRSQNGQLTLSSPDDGLEIYYTLGSSEPSEESTKYESPIDIQKATTISVVSMDPVSGEKSAINRINLDIPKSKWGVIIEQSVKAIDENNTTYYSSEDNQFEVDMGEKITLKGFTYTPMQARYPSGFIQNYIFEVSIDGKNWKQATTGEFSNIANNPIQQFVKFEDIDANYFRLKAVKTADGNPATFAEVGVLTR